MYLVVGGAPPAAEAAAFVEASQAIGWDVCVVPTRMGRRFVDTGHLARLTGHPLRDDYKYPHEQDVLPPADALVVAPATFNTVNKVATGISDTVWLGLLNDALGAGTPLVMAVYTSESLAAHPAFAPNLERLRRAGVRFVPDADPGDPGGLATLAHTADGAPLRWDDLRDEVEALHTELADHP